jgi:hypothetical protein
MIASSVTMIVAAEGPNSNTAAKTKASETEIRAFTDGNLMLNEPVRNARRARTSHWEFGGLVARSYADAPTARVPAATTSPMYTRTLVDSFEERCDIASPNLLNPAGVISAYSPQIINLRIFSLLESLVRG